MRSFTLAALALGAAAQVPVNPVPIPIPTGDLAPLPALSKRGTYTPCGEAAELLTTQKSQNATSLRVPAELAYKCLTSVPVDVKGDLAEIKELKAYLEYQSTLAWLKNGVEGHLKPVDIMGGLDAIAKGVQNGTYKSEFEVQYNIRTLITSGGDFHMTYTPDITAIFSFTRLGANLVSLSEDGVALPKLYMVPDLPKDINAKPAAGSEVVKINNQTATEILQTLVDGTSLYHDADARYNTLFDNPPLVAVGKDPGAIALTHYKYFGASTVYTFANGSSTTIENVALTSKVWDFSKVTDGPSFFKQFCNGPPQESQQISARQATPVRSSGTPSPTRVATSVVPSSPARSSVATPTASPSAGLPGYPKPVFLQESKEVSGYYLSNGTYSDVAVLVLPGFSPEVVGAQHPLVAGFVDSQNLVRKFLADSVKANKKRLVIDLRGNGGGTIDLGFELFKQLFPKIEPYGAARYRAHDAFHYYSAVTADIAAEGLKGDNSTIEFDDSDGIGSPFLWSNILDVNLQQYKSYQDYYGPETINGDTFTRIRRYNFSNNAGGHTLDVSLTGYNEFRNNPAQPFTSDNIVIIQDGYCGSTCAIFSQLMREQGKVQTIAVGGRPRNAPMQGVGGSKGSQLLEFDTLFGFANTTINAAKILNGEAVAETLQNNSNVGVIYNAEQIIKRSQPAGGTKQRSGGVNSLNNQRMNDSTNTPLEFVYEAADCRLFYTLKSYMDPVALWTQSIDAKWGNGSCVAGSTGDKSAIGVMENKPFAGKSNGTSPAQVPTNGAAGLGVSAGLMMVASVLAMLMM